MADSLHSCITFVPGVHHSIISRKMRCNQGKWLSLETSQEVKVGICGEHGGEPSSVGFCHRTGLDYVSCSPYRVPIARLAAAQAALADEQ